MMYLPFRQGVLSRWFELRMRMASDRRWEHWESLAFALGCPL
jgi:hypothetical protein